MKGLTSGGVRGTVVFTLPAGYRPSNNHRCGCYSSTTVYGTNLVEPDGDVLAVAGGAAGFMLFDTSWYAGF
jgi:hypothetical protein